MIVATIASLLGIIVTSFTIYSIMKPTTKTEEKKDGSTSVVVVHEKDGSATDSSATEQIPVLVAAKHRKQALNKLTRHR